MELILDLETYARPEIVEKFRPKAEELGICPRKYVATSPWLCEIVAIGYVMGDQRRVLVNRSVFPANARNNPVSADGFELLSFLNEKGMLVYFAGMCVDAGRFVSFAGRSFDLPTLHHRSLANGVDNPWVRSACFEYRFKPNCNMDLQDAEMTFFGAAKRPSLREVCVGYGLGDPKADGDGGDVQALVEQGRVLELATYCMSDVDYTCKLHHLLYPQTADIF